jgi:predicted ATP-binding protein involved in virulence
MMLRELVVEDLFGDFTHTITFKTADGLTLLHGPNGVGKTTVLRLLDSLFNRRIRQLRNQPFGIIRLEFDNGDRLQVAKRTSQDEQPSSLEFIFTPINDEQARTWAYAGAINVDIPLGMIDDIIPDVTRTGQREWTISTTGEILDLDAVLDKYEKFLPVRETSRNSVPPEWLSDLLERIPMFFIETDRLSTYGRDPRLRRPTREASQIPTVQIYSNELAEQIRRTLASYADSSQTLDSTFPTRLLQSDAQILVTPSDEEIRTRYAEQAERRSRYVRTGLLDAGDELQLPDKALDPMECRVLDTYLRDVDLKLDRLDDLADKLDLFLSIVNGKFRRKTIRVHRERGLLATTSTGQSLDLGSLSSGEQQEIVLAYGLLFREKPGTMILLDEPELSLHVSWQMDLIPDLLRIADLAKLEFLVATHSPQIINDRWDLTVKLLDE